MGQIGVAITNLPTVIFLKKPFSDGLRGVHFCLFFPFCLLITSDLRCVHPPPKNVFFIGAPVGGGARFVIS